MTGQPGSGQNGSVPAGPDGWRAAAPELAITAALVIATSAAVYGYAGTGAAVLAVIAWTVVALVLLRSLVPATAAPLAQPQAWRGTGRSSFIGFWRKRGVLTDATASMASYDAELRPTLQHLLAARLAERHDVNLYHDPAAARRLLLRGAREDQLWLWLDPSRPAETRQNLRGIPPRTLAAIIELLERL